MIDSVLIANRGAIAARIIRTCRRLGVRTVAIYVPQEAHAPYVQMADVAVPLVGASARNSFLDIPQILRIAHAQQVQAIHPGYGFLSENPRFAEACAAAKIIFVGPTAAAMAQLGNKLRAKQLLQNANVPLVPGGACAGLGAEKILAVANGIGFPILIKAAAGGGGKGMRVVTDPTQLASSIATAEREAQSAFGDPHVFLEKYLPSTRHIEVQIMADQQGHIVHFGERDCTIQRRHQKIIEEAPSPMVSPALRAAMGDVAVRIAQAASYTNVGTVEFLLAPSGDFYFLEVNTRLQVEHGVTELAYDVDLVEWQLRIAAGETIPFQQSAIAPRGHALQCRVYAEEPAHGFVPATGTITQLTWPNTMPVRIDSSVAAGMTIGIDFDPMLAKLIVHAADRPHAIAQMLQVLQQLQLRGVPTNQTFLAAVLRTEDFSRSHVDTHWTEQFVHRWRQYTIPTADPFTPWQQAEWRSDDASAANAPTAVASTRSRTPRKTASNETLTAPMPGRILQIHAQTAMAAAEGTVLVVMEAMKMEYQIAAPGDVTVRKIHCAVGDLVERGKVLIECTAGDGKDTGA